MYYVIHYYLVGGIPTPLKKMTVSWDDDIPNIWKNKSHVPNHQPVNLPDGPWSPNHREGDVVQGAR